jgi:hypothetical protein
MKNLIVVSLLMFILSDCKEKDPEPDPIIKEIIGKWRLVEQELQVEGNLVWTNASGDPQNGLWFRSDGALLDQSGLPSCCVPSLYTVNGVSFAVVRDTKLTGNPLCESVYCVSASLCEIQQEGNEMIATGCNGNIRSKYVRE